MNFLVTHYAPPGALAGRVQEVTASAHVVDWSQALVFIGPDGAEVLRIERGQWACVEPADRAPNAGRAFSKTIK